MGFSLINNCSEFAIRFVNFNIFFCYLKREQRHHEQPNRMEYLLLFIFAFNFLIYPHTTSVQEYTTLLFILHV